MRERRDTDDVVADRLRSVLADPVRGPGRTGEAEGRPAAAAPMAAAPQRREPADLAHVGEPLRWSDVITGWPEDVELEPLGEPSVEPEPAPGFPAGTPWASPPGAVPADQPITDRNPVPSEPGDHMREAEPIRARTDTVPALPDPLTKPLPPPAWVLPEDQQPTWTFESGVDDGPALSAAGAFGGASDDRRGGLRAFDPGRRGARVLAVVAVVAIVVAALLAWRARPRIDPVAPPSFEVTGTTGAAVEGAAAAPGASSAATVVLVAVSGRVRSPGVVRLPPGSRVADALTAAGGAEPGVDVTMLNLARKVVDGELILVGVTPSPGVGTGPAAPAAGGGGPVAGAPVNLNTATLADLDGLPGVGPVLAQRILDARTAQGGFRAVGDLRKVDGIGEARYEQLKDLVTV